jgi:hypothetical protein
MDANQFNEAYWLSQPPEVQKLRSLQGEARSVEAVNLAIRGFCIDKWIQADGHDAYPVMFARELYGYAWVPSILQEPVPVVPGIDPPAGSGWKKYDPTNPPVGSIKVSTKMEDFSPFVLPTPPTPQVPVDAKPGLPIGGRFFGVLPGDASPDGTKYADATGAFIKHVTLTPFGHSQWWEKQ